MGVMIYTDSGGGVHRFSCPQELIKYYIPLDSSEKSRVRKHLQERKFINLVGTLDAIQTPPKEPEAPLKEQEQVGDVNKEELPVFNSVRMTTEQLFEKKEQILIDFKAVCVGNDIEVEVKEQFINKNLLSFMLNTTKYIKEIKTVDPTLAYMIAHFVERNEQIITDHFEEQRSKFDEVYDDTLKGLTNRSFDQLEKIQQAQEEVALLSSTVQDLKTKAEKAANEKKKQKLRESLAPITNLFKRDKKFRIKWNIR